MKPTLLLLFALFSSLVAAFAGVGVDQDEFAKNLGGWKKPGKYVDYELSGANYRTYKPESSPTPDGGIFVSIRIDYLRGWLASDDHATLEITVSSKGAIVAAQSTIAIQGQSIASDVIVGSSEAGKEIINPNRTVQIGTDLVSNLTAKLLLENIVEAGRVSFPAVIRHNYNRIFQAIRVEGIAVMTAVAIPDEPIVLPPVPPPAPPAVTPPVAPVLPTTPAVTPAPVAPATPPITPASPTPTLPVTPAAPDPAKPATVPLEIKQY
ncbi:MAG: hypothetical protein ABIS50_03095 [Luteolibacter sp.]|uniref:hypothetical protein n=1 Tax=Luteolibacter sp. TaxID=1962973 RepID=UPI00326630B3